ncbi:DNA adenine methylase [Natronospira proteinivora]|uniref:site-specific DNA-methyltransferase (adenine-specific) n=2 Tax=Natronospira proteinivora TaxID=1807133 RepID=A0ABT1G7I8_9GAMM|nr:DNA adenine methylase [Natronospira proteinivora]
MAEIMRANDLSGGWYAEPYVGGAGVALHLLLGGYVRKVYINDIDPAVYAFWESVLNFPDELISLLWQAPITVEERDKQVGVLNSIERHSTVDVGFAALYVNRTSRSGILSGGVVGGRSQAGMWKIDARFNKKTISERIELVSRYSNRICLFNLDALDFLTQLPAANSDPGLVYLDPPYFSKGGGLYRNAYQHGDHESIAEFVKHIEYPWVVTYDDTPEIEDLYHWAKGGRFSIYYTANNSSRRHATELIYTKGLDLDPPPYSKR